MLLDSQPRSLKSATTATMVEGPKECYFIFWSPKSLFCPLTSIYGPPQGIVLSLKFQIICLTKIIVLSPQIPFPIAPEIILSPQILLMVPHFGIWRNRSIVYALFVAASICHNLPAFEGTNQAINLRLGDPS